MAERRMFSKKITNSARFLKMPLSTQALYFHLGLQADDDGIVEAYTVVQTVGAAEDDLRVLCSKGFVQVLNEDLVTYITDWRENNKLRADRKIDSIYKDLLLQIVPDADLLRMQNRAGRAPRVPELPENDTGRPGDDPGAAQVRLGEVRLGEESIVEDLPAQAKPAPRSRFVKPTLDQIKEYCQERRNRVNPARFFDYYESNGWKVGRSPMKDWKAAVRTWEQRESKEPKQKSSNPFLDMMEEEGYGQS